METAFLKRITDEPDDAVARLVFADWLREQDDTALNERGEFIHLQHALAAGTVSPAERLKLVARQKALLNRHRDRWEESFRGLVGHCEYRAGFAERVALTAEQFVDGFAELVERTPVVRVRLSGLTADTVAVVASIKALAELRELDLSGTWLTAPVLAEFLASPYLARLRSLNLARTHVGDEGVRALVATNVFRRLRYLNLSRADVTVSGVHALVNGIYNRDVALEMLVFRGAPRLQPGAFPPVPLGLSYRLRQALQAQLGLAASHWAELNERLSRERATLPAGVRHWAEWLQTNGSGALPRAVKVLPLPDRLRRAFTLVCRRRLVWRANRLGFVPPDEDRDSEDLPHLLKLLLEMGDRREEHTLAACFLDLYLRYERAELPEDGRTR